MQNHRMHNCDAASIAGLESMIRSSKDGFMKYHICNRVFSSTNLFIYAIEKSDTFKGIRQSAELSARNFKHKTPLSTLMLFMWG